MEPLSSTVITAAIFIIILTALGALKKDRTTILIDEIPGPKPWPLVGNFFDEFEHRNDIMWKVTQREKKHPLIYRVWHGRLPVVYVSSPEMFEKILGSKSRHLSKGFFYSFLLPWLGTGLLTSEGSKWAARRKLLTPAFHHRILNDYLVVFHENAKILVRHIAGKAENREVFDVYPFVSLCTLDIICEAAMGQKINAQTHGKSPYASAIYRVLHLTKERFLKFWLFADFVYFATRAGREYRRQVGVLHEFTSGIIEERKTLMKARKESLIPPEDVEIGVTRKTRAFLDLLLREAGRGESDDLTDEDVREEVDTFAFEGHETTAVAICWNLLLLAAHPDVQEEAYQEQAKIFAEDGTRTPTVKDLAEMKLLERIMKETSRMYPSIPLIARIPEEDIPTGPYTIPKGTTVILNIFALHRNPGIYPDPERFDPDRFLLEKAQKRHPYAHVPFSAGSRNCIGQKFAVMEEKVILSEIIRSYRVEASGEDVHLVNELLLKSRSGVKIKLSRREVPSDG